MAQNTYAPNPLQYTSGPPNSNTNTNNASHYPSQQYQHHQQRFYPNPYPPHSQSQPPAQSPSYAQPQGFQGQPDGQRQQFQPNVNVNVNHGNGHGPLMQRPTPVPDDPFKKPYLPPQRTAEPQQQYTQYAQSPPANLRYDQPNSSFSYPPRQQPISQAQGSVTSSSQPSTSSMTATALPAVSSAQTTPTSETPTQPADAIVQASKISPLDQERVDALLNVNNLLLQEVTILQKAGLKTVPNPQSPHQPNHTGQTLPQTKIEGSNTTPTSTNAPVGDQNSTTASTSSTPTTTTPTTATPSQPSNNPNQNVKKFGEYMGRLKTNIMYLVTISDPTKAKHRPPYPTHLEEPPAWLVEGVKEEDREIFEALKEAYVKLRELWPDWKPQPRPQMGQQQMMQQQAMAQKQAQQQNQQAQIQNQQAQM